MIKIDGTKIIFSSGRCIYAYEGVVGLSASAHNVRASVVYGGYDDYNKIGSEYSAEDRAELANHMIDTWMKWRDAKPESDND